jgi:hypothetical protein
LVPEVGPVRQVGDELRLELRPVSPRNDRHPRDLRELRQQRPHFGVDRLLALGERPVEIECNQLLHADSSSFSPNETGAQEVHRRRTHSGDQALGRL